MPLPTNNDIERARLIFASDRATGSSAVLEITTRLGTAAADLDFRHGRSLLVLQEAFDLDFQRPAALRGLRHPDRIGELLDPSPTGYAPSAFAIRSYFSQINRRLREAWAKLGLAPPKLFTSMRGAGFKLLQPLEVEYLERTQDR